MRSDQLVQGCQSGSAGTDMICQAGDVEIDALASVTLALPVQGLASRAGNFTPRAPRTVREPLDSYGSQHPAATVQKRPVGEEPGLSPDQLRQPSSGATWTPLEPLELASHPPEEMRIDPTQGRIERRLVEVAEVVDPPADVLIEHPGYVEQPLVAAPLKAPAAHCVPDGFQSLRTRRRQERDPVEPAPPLRQPRPEC